MRTKQKPLFSIVPVAATENRGQYSSNSWRRRRRSKCTNRQFSFADTWLGLRKSQNSNQASNGKNIFNRVSISWVATSQWKRREISFSSGIHVIPILVFIFSLLRVLGKKLRTYVYDLWFSLDAMCQFFHIEFESDEDMCASACSCSCVMCARLSRLRCCGYRINTL